MAQTDESPSQLLQWLGWQLWQAEESRPQAWAQVSQAVTRAWHLLQCRVWQAMHWLLMNWQPSLQPRHWQLEEQVLQPTTLQREQVPPESEQQPQVASKQQAEQAPAVSTIFLHSLVLLTQRVPTKQQRLDKTELESLLHCRGLSQVQRTELGNLLEQVQHILVVGFKKYPPAQAEHSTLVAVEQQAVQPTEPCWARAVHRQQLPEMITAPLLQTLHPPAVHTAQLGPQAEQVGVVKQNPVRQAVQVPPGQLEHPAGQAWHKEQ